MNGVHDMGGMHGFGAVPVTDDAEFHADWERLVYCMVRIVRAQGIYNADESRFGIERMPPGEYLEASYFERWLSTLERNLIEKGVLTAAEIDAANERALALEDPAELVPETTDPDIAGQLRSAFERDATHPDVTPEPEFHAGETVRVRNNHPAGHTRCPRYVRRAIGEVVDVHEPQAFPDAQVRGEDRIEPLYTVSFSARELWGADAETPNDSIAIDLWEPYLRPASDSDDDPSEPDEVTND